MLIFIFRETPAIISRCFPDVLVIFAKIYEWKQMTLMHPIYCNLHSGMTYGTTIRDLCLRLNPHALRIDEQRLVRFGVLKGIIRRIQKEKKRKRKRKRERERKRKRKRRKDEESSAIVLNVLSFD